MYNYPSNYIMLLQIKDSCQSHNNSWENEYQIHVQKRKMLLI